MKVLFLTRWYLPYAGIFIERHAQAVSLYHDLAVLAILPSDKRSGMKPVVEPASGQNAFPVIRYFYRSSGCRVAAIAGLINNLRFLTRAFAGYSYATRHYGTPHLIHVHVLTRAALPAFLLKIFTGRPYVISEHWTRYIPENWGYRGVLRRFLTRLVVRRAAAVTTVSEFLKQAMQDCGLRHEKFIVIPNTIDTFLFTFSGKPECRKKKRILHVSNFHERAKNIRGILRVIAKLAGQRDDFDIAFIGGEEPALRDARKYASTLGLDSPLVTFSGPIAAEALAEIYRESDFLLMFSNFESFSIVIPEALACGTPVLATEVGGIPEYFSNGAGRLVAPGDEAALLETLGYMLDHYQSFDPGYLCSIVENRFGYRQVGRQFDELYRSVMNKKVPS